jgi:hypothetical protein
LDPEVLEFEKIVIKPESKGSNFGRSWLKLVPRELSHKFLNVRTRSKKVLSKRKNGTTLVEMPVTQSIVWRSRHQAPP